MTTPPSTCGARPRFFDALRRNAFEDMKSTLKLMEIKYVLHEVRIRFDMLILLITFYHYVRLLGVTLFGKAS